MLARYYDFVDRMADIALVQVSGTNRLHANAAGRPAFAANEDRFNDGLSTAAAQEQLVIREIAGRRIVFVPLFSERDGVEAVLAAQLDIAMLPAILNDLHAPMRHFGEIVHLLPQIVLTARPNGTIDYASRRLLETIVPPDVHDASRSTFFHAVVDEHRAAAETLWTQGIAAKDAFEGEFRFTTRTGERWFCIDARPYMRRGSLIKWAISLCDVDARVRAREALERAQHRLRTLAEIGRQLVGAPDSESLANDAARRLAAWSGGTAVIELCDRGERIAIATHPRDARLVTERIVSVARGTADPDLAHVLAAPIRGDGVCGFVAVSTAESTIEADEDGRLVAEVAERVGIVLANMLAYKREARIAETLQRSMLPVALPHVHGITFDVAYAPAESELLVGGDWYDAFVLSNGHVVIAIGDVGGHGLDAAIVMGTMRRAIRNAALESDDPATILARANATAIADRSPIVTAFVGLLDPLTHTMRYAVAGHPPPICVARDGSLRVLDCDGPPLGTGVGEAPTTRKIEIPVDAALVLYTDGVVEADRNAIDAEERLHALLRDWGRAGFHTRAEDLQEHVIGNAVRFDDAAMLVVRFTPSDQLNVTIPATIVDGRRARTAVQRYVKTLTFTDDRTHDIVLAVSEAINNATEHAYEGVGPGEVRIALDVVHDTFVAVVSDDGRWRPPVANDRGRGLNIIRALTDSCTLERDLSGTTVTLAVRLPDSAIATTA